MSAHAVDILVLFLWQPTLNAMVQRVIDIAIIITSPLADQTVTTEAPVARPADTAQHQQ